MAPEGADGDVMVAVEDPDHVTQLVRTAGDLARVGAETVRLVTVVVKPYDSPFGVFTDETIIEEFAADSRELLEQASAPEDVEVVRDLVVARSVAKGIRSAVDRTDPSALVIGWDADPSRSDHLLGGTVDAVLDRAPTDVYVERIGREAGTVDSILLPVAGGPHVGAAARVTKAIARTNDATIHVISVSTDQSGEHVDHHPDTFVAEGVEAVEDARGPSVTLSSRVIEGQGVTDTIVDAAADHDVVVLGATRKGPLRGRLVGSVPRRVVHRSDSTVLIARDGDVVGGITGRVATLLNR